MSRNDRPVRAQSSTLRSQTSSSLRKAQSGTLRSMSSQSSQSSNRPESINHTDSKAFFQEEVTVDKELSIQQSLIFRSESNAQQSFHKGHSRGLSSGDFGDAFPGPEESSQELTSSFNRNSPPPPPPKPLYTPPQTPPQNRDGKDARPDIYNAQSSVYSRASSGGDKVVDLAPLKSGKLVLLKFSRLGEPLERLFTLSEDCRFLTYNSSIFAFKPITKKRIDMESVKRILKGQQSTRFEELKVAEIYPGATSRSFSIIYGENDASLDLIAPTVEDFRLWYKGLNKVVTDIAFSREYTKLDVLFLKAKYQTADKNNDGVLSKSEIFKLLTGINVNMTTAAVDVLFRKVDKDDSGTLNFDEFSNFVQVIRRRHDIEFLWDLLVTKQFFDEKIQHCQSFDISKKCSKLTVKGSTESLIPHNILTESVSVTDFQNFWGLFQGTRLSDAEAKSMIQEAMPGVDTKSGAPVLLSYAGFLQIMTSQTNDAYDPSKKRKDSENLFEPLSNYYIASSHNTYLAGDQLTGTSTVDRYVDVLEKGCRCVELDVYDGDAGPVITHGFTLTSKISFAEVIRAIKENAFAANSLGEVNEFPVILSIENHCSWEQQKMMADILKHELGVMIQRSGMGIKDGRLPILSDLKRKILIKGKQSASETEESDDDEAPSTALVTQDKDAALGTAEKPRKKTKSPGTHPDLSGLIFLGTAPSKDFSESSSVPCDIMSSFSESKVEKITRNESSVAAWINHNMVHMSRAYPKGLRIDSSNMDPSIAWSAGAQMAALNYQHNDISMFLNHGKFMQNRNCGYVLKPFYMRNPGATHLGERTMEVHVFGGHQLPKPGAVSFGEVIDPYVLVNICGVQADNVEFRTKTVDNNGFNPVWDEVFTFTVTNPECAQLLFRVYDADLDRDDFVAFSSIPVLNLLEGFRNVSLFDKSGSRQGDMLYASLSIRVKLLTK